MARRRRRRQAEVDEATQGDGANCNFGTRDDSENVQDALITVIAPAIHTSTMRMSRLPSMTPTVVEETEEGRRWTDEKKPQILRDGLMGGALKLHQDEKVRDDSDPPVDGCIDNSKELAAGGSADGNI